MENKDFDSIFYHYPCADGVGALWAALKYKEIKHKYGCKAGQDPNIDINDLQGEKLLFVDYCPPIEFLEKLLDLNKKILILDHHISSYERTTESNILDNPNITAIFDMDKSGCQITWDYFFEDMPRPEIIDYIGDKDLWLWKKENSREINTALYFKSYFDHDNLEKLSDLHDNWETEKPKLINDGAKINQYNQKQIDISLNNATYSKLKFNNETYKIWIGGGNITPGLRNELGNELLNKKFNNGKLPDFSATWQYNLIKDEWWISLRGNENSPDLAKIAESYGGGGHKCAAGFTIKSPEGLRSVFYIN